MDNPQKRKTVYDSLQCISSMDGREAPFTYELRPFFPEGCLHRYRSVVEVEALIALSESDFARRPVISEKDKRHLRALTGIHRFNPKYVAEYDHFGRNGIGPLEQDVKAVEMYLREMMDRDGMSDLKEWVHFLTTSEDINNIAWSLMLREATNSVWLPAVLTVADKIEAFSGDQGENTPVVGITHEVKASPTTMEKRFSHFLYKIMDVLEPMSKLRFTGKFSGPVGNHNAITVLAPEFDYEQFARTFVERFGLEFSENSNQCNSHISIMNFLDHMRRLNDVCFDLCVAIQLNVLVGNLYLTDEEYHAGSSIMPNKINPWRIEVARERFRKSSILIAGAAQGLLSTILERDAGDHVWERSYGEMMGESLIGLRYLSDGFDQLHVDSGNAREGLEKSFEVLLEAVQLEGRMEGIPDIYMKIKRETMGKTLDGPAYRRLVRKYIKDPVQCKVLLDLVPVKYIGRAQKIAHATVQRYHELRPKLERGILDDSRSIDAVLFDFDNTLQLGDKDELTARLTAIAKKMSLEFTPEEILNFGNRSDYKEMRALMVDAYNRKHPDAVIIEDQFEAVNKLVSGKFDHMFRLAPGVKEMLLALKKSGKKLGIVTTRGGNSLPRLLKMHGIADYFDVVINRSDTQKRKPHPEPIAIALERLGIRDASRVLYVGDLQTDDVIAGNALGAKTVLITNNPIDPRGARPTYPFQTLNEVRRRFSR